MTKIHKICIYGILTGLFLLPSFNLVSQNKSDEDESLMKSSSFSAFKFRSIGPAYTSGRIADFAVNPENHSEYYVAVAAGNVWKTENAGITYSPIFDNYGSYSIADVEIDPNNTNVVWVGTGEYNSQRAIGYGDGVYCPGLGSSGWSHGGKRGD